MSGWDIAVAVGLVLGVLTVVYSFVRLAWRLRQGDVEPIGSDSDLFRRRKK